MKLGAVVVTFAVITSACEPGADLSRGGQSLTPSPTEKARPRATAAPDHFRLVARRGAFKVYAPKRLWGLCPPNPLPLSRDHLKDAERAVVRAAESGQMTGKGFDPRGARARAFLGSEGGVFKYARKKCGEEVVARTAIVDIHFPKMEPSASLSNSTFYVSREQRGWILWDWPS